MVFLWEKQLIWNMAFLLKFSCFCNNWTHVQQKEEIFVVTHNQECKKRKRRRKEEGYMHFLVGIWNMPIYISYNIMQFSICKHIYIVWSNHYNTLCISILSIYKIIKDYNFLQWNLLKCLFYTSIARVGMWILNVSIGNWRTNQLNYNIFGTTYWNIREN